MLVVLQERVIRSRFNWAPTPFKHRMDSFCGTLQEFSMYTSFYMVNINNCRFRLTDDTAATELLLTQQNYKNVADVAENFGVPACHPCP